MLVRINQKDEITASFQDPSFNPAVPFDSVFAIEEDFLDAISSDPALQFASLSMDPEKLAISAAKNALRSTLRVQQYIVYDISSQLGVLSPYVGVTQNALKGFDVFLTKLDQGMALREAIVTGIGIAGDVLSAVPTLYTQIAGAVIELGVWVANLFIRYKANLPTQELAQEYSKGTDLQQFNGQLRAITETDFDWTQLFMPRYSGELAAEARQDAWNRYVIAFAPGNGKIARVTGAEGRGTSRTVRIGDEGTFEPTGGLGFVPGGQRILSVFQVTALEAPGGPEGKRKTVYDPRCGGTGKSQGFDVGSWYPVTAQGAMSLWDFIWQRGAAMYTIDPSRAKNAWRYYFNQIWRGVETTWGNPAYNGNSDQYGWGCGFWESALQDLVGNYTVGIDGNIGGTLSWRIPILTSDQHASISDDTVDQWEKNNAYTQIIAPALERLKEAQIWYLENTTIAAYLPIIGGKDADPLAQDRVMGAFGEGHLGMRTKFVNARNRILEGTAKHDVRLRDVLDPVYRQQIKSAGGGTEDQQFGLVARIPGEPNAVTPEGGVGLGAQSGLVLPSLPSAARNQWSWIAGGTAVAGATVASYYLWDDIARLAASIRGRVLR